MPKLLIEIEHDGRAETFWLDRREACVAGTPAQTEDMSVGYIELTATERSYLQAAITEMYVGDHRSPPGVPRQEFWRDLARHVTGPLRLVTKPEPAGKGESTLPIRLRWHDGLDEVVEVTRDRILDTGIVIVRGGDRPGYFAYEPHHMFRAVPVFNQVDAVVLTGPKPPLGTREE